jgi:signal peptidase
MAIIEPAVKAKAPKDDEKLGTWGLIKGFLKGLGVGVAIIAVLIAFAAIVYPRLIGGVPLTVLSGSMVPTFNPGDLVITKPVDAKDLKRGDIITFQPKSDDPSLITHRVISIGTTLAGKEVIVTKGDANNAQDPSIMPEQVKGEYVYRIPYLGFVANAVPANLKGYAIQIIGGAVLLYVLYQIVSAAFSKRKEKKSTDDTITKTE